MARIASYLSADEIARSPLHVLSQLWRWVMKN